MDWNLLLGALLVIILANLQQAQGLECYKCKSSNSWADCSKSQTKVTCKSAKQCCKYTGTTTAGGNTCTVYQKSCEDEKENIKCEGQIVSSWSFSSFCCSGGLCNAGQLIHGNIALVLAVFVALKLCLV